MILCSLISGSLFALETEEGYLIEGEQRDYSRYGNREYTPRVEKIRGTVVDSTKVFLFWEKIHSDNVSYTVIRNTRPLNTYSSIKSATIVARLTDKNQVLDSSISADGSYFYGILTKTEGKRQDIQLVADKSYINRPFIISGLGRGEGSDTQRNRSGSTSYTAQNLRVGETSSGLTLRWNNPPGFSGLVYLYTSPQAIKDSSSLQRSRLLMKSRGRHQFFLSPKPQGRLYFCVLLEKNGSPHYTFNDFKNCISYSSADSYNQVPTESRQAPTDEMQEYQGSDEKQDSINNNDIDRIVRSIYRTDNYGPLEKRLIQIARSTSSPQTKARALFFIGRIRVEKGEYRSALKLFYRADVQKYFKEESQFWQDYCLSQLH